VIFTIALRNLIRQRERFLVLLVTLMLGGWLFVVLMGTMNSFSESLKQRAARYFSGDVTLTGYNNRPVDRWIDDEMALIAAVKASGVPIASWTRRSINYDQNTTLFFAGTSQGQRRLIGVDWSLETPSFRHMDFVAGGPDDMVKGDGILISDVAATKLKVHVGDDLLVLMATKTGQKNTMNLTVRGIFRDASFFGYSSYVDIRALNRALGVPETAAAEIGLMLPPNTDAIGEARRVWEALKSQFPLISFSVSEDQLNNNLKKEAIDEKRRYAVLPLQTRLGPIQSILDALSAVAWSLNLLFLLIVLVGVNNTYRMIVYERTKEIGTMRALGMDRGRLAALFLVEAGLLGLAGALIGWGLGNLLLWVASIVDFGDNVLMAMFLERGHLAWSVPWAVLASVTASLVTAALLGSVGPAWRAASWRPVDALRHET
jgi:putative ABC transport system permease protein